MLPVGTVTGMVPFAETIPRQLASAASTSPSTGVLTLSAIWLPGDVTVSGITFVSAGTPESGGSHLWYALYKCANPNGTGAVTLMAQSADDTGAASFSANTAFRKALTTPQKLTYSGQYYIGYMCVGTSANLANLTSNTNVGGGVSGMTPILAATADGGLTTTAPSTAGAMTALSARYYALVD